MRAVEDVAVVHHLRDKTGSRRLRDKTGSRRLRDETGSRRLWRRFAGWRRPLAQSRAKENGLPGVRVAHPLIERQRAQKLAGIDYLVEQGIRQKVVDHNFARIAWI